MKARFRKYKPEQDFLRIRDFLAETYRAFEQPVNWRIERWNYTRYHVAPLIGDPDPEQSARNIRFWEDTVGIWENDARQIVGVVTTEHPQPGHRAFGDAFLFRRPGYDFLLGEMLDYAEGTFVNTDEHTLTTFVYDHDEPFLALVEERGYSRGEHPGYDSEFVIEGDLPACQLPEGYVIRSMVDGGDLALRCKAFGLAFNHPDPKDWPTVASYTELQKAPDYRGNLDLWVVSPGGEYVSFCIVWYDGVNRMGILEPVGTHPDFRRRGLAKAVVMEGIRRAAALGAERVWVGSGQEFYEAIGFQKRHIVYLWMKRL
jgi:GNAT superfamily N-acetyltransferase